MRSAEQGALRMRLKGLCVRGVEMHRRISLPGSLAVLAALAALALPAVAMADAANPSQATTGTKTIHPNGAVTVSLRGAWTWKGQSCTGRYGVGWSVDWWGVGSLQPPARFEVVDATTVVGTGSPNRWTTTAVETATIAVAGALTIPASPGKPQTYFHTGSSLSGQNLSLCANAVGKTLSGAWTASGTYPAAGLIPGRLCVNLYDLHGKPGRSSGKPSAFSPLANDDNSIETNDYDPSVGGNCMLTSSLDLVDDDSASTE